MRISSDDPKLTAYALGELDKNEAEQIEREVQNNPKLRQAVAEVRETAALLRGELSNEPTLSLSETQKSDVLAKTKPDNIISFPRQRIFKVVGIGAIAASLALVLTWQFGQNSKRATIAPTTNSEFRYAQNAISQAQKNGVVEEEKSVLAETIDPAWIGVLENPKVPQSPDNPFVSRYPVEIETGKADGSTPVVKIQSNDALSKTTTVTTSSGRSSILVQGNPKSWSASLSGVTTSEPQLVEAEISVGNPTVFKNSLKNLNASTGADGGGSGGGGGGKGNLELSGISKIPETALALSPSPNDRFYRLNDGTATLTRFARNGKKPGEIGAPGGTAPGTLVNGITTGNAGSVPTRNYSDYNRSGKIDESLYDGYTYSRKLTPVEIAEVEAVRNQNYAVERRSTTPTASELEMLRKRFTPDQLRYFLHPSETARYPKYVENDFRSVSQEPLSTFSIDVDTASYANVRRFLNENRLPPGDAVRIEELINYFSYNYPQPKGDEPFSANLEVAGCPWNSQHGLVRIGLKGKEIAQDKRPASNFVFLIDVSGSMSPAGRLPLIKQALRMLVKRMTENDRIAIVVYASSSGVVLESTSCANKEKILEALDRLEAGGSTNGGEGVQRAYALAEENFIKGGVNRVILCTDGDFNVGITDQSELVNLIQRKAKSGVFLSALGVGTDNYKDALMQKLADKGNGNYHYIDTMEEAQKVLIQQMNGTLVTIAKDVKIQIEFNPAQVSSYRLIGYEKRILAAEDFNNDKKDAGEIGAGHTVTALYEIVPTNGQDDGPRGKVDDLKYQKPAPKPKREISNDNPELLTFKLRYKKPDGNTSKLSETTVTDSGKNFSQASSDFKFASAVAGFGMILKNSEHKGEWTFNSVLDVAEKSKGDDKEGYRAEFINLVKKAMALHQRE